MVICHLVMKRGPYSGRQLQYKEARRLRSEGLGYRMIARAIEVPWRTIAHWVDDIPVDPKEAQRLYQEERTRNATGKIALRNRLINERGNQCEDCYLCVWQELPIALELHRVDADAGYKESNVRLLCPNCHALTDNWRGRGIKKKNIHI